jgi:hypothetical protein
MVLGWVVGGKHLQGAGSDLHFEGPPRAARHDSQLNRVSKTEASDAPGQPSRVSPARLCMEWSWLTDAVAEDPANQPSLVKEMLEEWLGTDRPPARYTGLNSTHCVLFNPV